MAHESFEDPETAAFMNEHFVNVKVDREERPDVDAIYMEAVQAITGQGGWPMTVFLDPEGVPFYGGTYFPPDDRHGMPSFRRCWKPWSTPSRASATKSEQRAPQMRARLAAIGQVEPGRLAAGGDAGRGDRAPARWPPTARAAASAARPSSRPPRRSSCLLARGETRDTPS